jgi:hypothetical protein
MTRGQQKGAKWWAKLAAIVFLALAAGSTAFTACGGKSCKACDSSCNCPSFSPTQTGTGWCPPGPNDCQACKFVICPDYCVTNGALESPFYCGDAGT